MLTIFNVETQYGFNTKSFDEFRRLIKRGYTLTATVTLPCRRFEDRKSRNIIYEVQGSTDEVVLIGGHTDSWECHHLGCQGAHDDGQVCTHVIFTLI